MGKVYICKEGLSKETEQVLIDILKRIEDNYDEYLFGPGTFGIVDVYDAFSKYICDQDIILAIKS